MIRQQLYLLDIAQGAYEAPQGGQVLVAVRYSRNEHMTNDDRLPVVGQPLGITQNPVVRLTSEHLVLLVVHLLQVE
ncbi:hypothetical protein D3C73_1442760 [compost metagenome]